MESLLPQTVFVFCFSLCIWHHCCCTSIPLKGFFLNVFMKYYICLLYCIYNRTMYCIYLSVNSIFVRASDWNVKKKYFLGPNMLLSRDSRAEPGSIHIALWTTKNTHKKKTLFVNILPHTHTQTHTCAFSKTKQVGRDDTHLLQTAFDGSSSRGHCQWQSWGLIVSIIESLWVFTRLDGFITVGEAVSCLADKSK